MVSLDAARCAARNEDAMAPVGSDWMPFQTCSWTIRRRLGIAWRMDERRPAPRRGQAGHASCRRATHLALHLPSCCPSRWTTLTSRAASIFVVLMGGAAIRRLWSVEARLQSRRLTGAARCIDAVSSGWVASQPTFLSVPGVTLTAALPIGARRTLPVAASAGRRALLLRAEDMPRHSRRPQWTSYGPGLSISTTTGRGKTSGIAVSVRGGGGFAPRPPCAAIWRRGDAMCSTAVIKGWLEWRCTC